MAESGSPRPFPTWLKVAATVFVAVLVPVYGKRYGPANFLWFSDIALFLTVAALWLESKLLVSIAAVGTMLLEIGWNIDFVLQLTGKIHYFGLSDYMLDPGIPVFVRALSLFHVPLPFLWLWMLHRLRYDRRAVVIQTIFAWIVLPATFALGPRENVNWVYGFGPEPQRYMPPWSHLLLLMVLFPTLVYMPSHLLLTKLFPPRPPTARNKAAKSSKA
ncbi:MAG TPA: membrane-associated protein [Phycisphaerae bacterium]|nr:membrane-associated protein [Phycisphaerae bacterium]